MSNQELAVDYMWLIMIAFFPLFSEEYFPGIRIEGDSSYFVRDCSDLTEEEKVEMKNNFAALLNGKNVCALRASKLCDINDMGIICAGCPEGMMYVNGAEDCGE